jgi:hypothetical protein
MTAVAIFCYDIGTRIRTGENQADHQYQEF